MKIKLVGQLFFQFCHVISCDSTPHINTPHQYPSSISHINLPSQPLMKNSCKSSRRSILTIETSWVVSTITSKTDKSSISQVVHYTFVEGHLLVDGKTLGVLPRSIRESEDIKDLFGNQHLLTFPSSLEGMSHFLATPIPGHQIHVGLRGKNVVIQTLTWDGLLPMLDF